MEHRAIRAFLPSFKGEPWSLPAALLLHALLLLALSDLLASKRPLPPVEERIPVEVWSPEQWETLTRPPAKAPELPSPPENPEPALVAPPQPAAPQPRGQGMIRASRILSGETLARPGSKPMRQALGLMEEETRLEQLCDIEAMAQIAESLKAFQPDRVVAYARAEVKLSRNILTADGAAFRSSRKWYDLKFRCELSRDRKSVQAFEFLVGDAIPKRSWEAYSLPSPALDTD